MERAFEWLLYQSRLMVVLAVAASILAAFIVIVAGTWDILLVAKGFVGAIGSKAAFKEFHPNMITGVVSAVDSYLIATVLLIFGIGLYELFISKISFLEADERSSKILVVHSLDELKGKLAKVILMVLIVTFFKHALHYQYDDIIELLYLSISIVLIAGAIFLTSKDSKNKQ